MWIWPPYNKLYKWMRRDATAWCFSLWMCLNKCMIYDSAIPSFRSLHAHIYSNGLCVMQISSQIFPKLCRVSCTKSLIKQRDNTNQTHEWSLSLYHNLSLKVNICLVEIINRVWLGLEKTSVLICGQHGAGAYPESLPLFLNAFLMTRHIHL